MGSMATITGGMIMAKSMNAFLTTVMVLTMTCGCNGETSKNIPDTGSGQPTVMQTAQAGWTGKVVETMSTAGYTYVQVDTGKEKIWAAAPEFPVQVGDEVSVPMGAPMKNFQSKTLDRTFDIVYFVSGITAGGTAPATAKRPAAKMPGGMSKPVVTASKDMDFSGIVKPHDGKTVAEVYAEKEALAGNDVKVRGKVVKYSAMIMGKNWIHLQDGTGTTGTNDLTITTTATAKVGDTILASGVLSVGKDFGAGYSYDVIIEDAVVVVE